MFPAFQLVQTCSNDDLHRVLYPVALSLVDAPLGLSARERWALSTILVLVSLGYSEIRCYLSALTACANRVHTSNISARTMRRALSDLEGRAFLRRRTFRAGDMLHIELKPILAEMLAKKKRVQSSNVSHISAHRTACPPPEKDRISQNSDILVFSSNALGAREEIDTETIDYYENQRRDREKRGRKSERWDPIVRTIYYVAGAARFWAMRAAREEIRAGGGPSGIDWAFWASRWPALTIQQRESYMLREILPVLRSAGQRGSVSAPGEKPGAVCEEIPPLKARSDFQKPVAALLPEDPTERALFEARERAQKRAADLNRWDREEHDRTVEAPEEDFLEIRTRILRSLGKPARSGGPCGS